MQKDDRITEVGTAADSELQPNVTTSASIEANPMLADVYRTTYEVSELIYHLLFKNIDEVIVVGGCLYEIRDTETILKHYPDSLNAKNPNKVYYRTKDPFHHFSETRELTEKELSDFKYLKENGGKYHTLTYEKDGQICERQLYVR